MHSRYSPHAIHVVHMLLELAVRGGSDDSNLVSQPNELTLQMYNMLRHTAGIRKVIGGDKRDLQRCLR